MTDLADQKKSVQSVPLLPWPEIDFGGNYRVRW